MELIIFYTLYLVHEVLMTASDADGVICICGFYPLKASSAISKSAKINAVSNCLTFPDITSYSHLITVRTQSAA